MSKTTVKSTSERCESANFSADRLPPPGFEKFDPTRCDPSAIDAIKRVFASHNYPVVIYGRVGSGKSYLATWAYVNVKGTSRFIRWSTWLDECLRRSKKGNPGEWESLKEVGLLVIDEIGVGSTNAWRNEMLLNVLDLRSHKPTVITTNLEPKQFPSFFDNRVASRLCAGALIRIESQDQRTAWIDDPIEREKRKITIGQEIH